MAEITLEPRTGMTAVQRRRSGSETKSSAAIIQTRANPIDLSENVGNMTHLYRQFTQESDKPTHNL